MGKKAWKPAAAVPSKRRVYTDEFRREAVQMMLDGHTAASVAERLDVPSFCYSPCQHLGIRLLCADQDVL